MKCEDCKYYLEYDDGQVERLGECRRHALGPRWFDFSDADEFHPEWPQTKPDDWCGEFKSKTPPKNLLLTGIKFSIRTRNCLDRIKITSLEQLSEYTSLDLLRIKNFGVSCLSEVEAVLSAKGLSLKRR